MVLLGLGSNRGDSTQTMVAAIEALVRFALSREFQPALAARDCGAPRRLTARQTLAIL